LTERELGGGRDIYPGDEVDLPEDKARELVRLGAVEIVA
jgi:hypothetical protein